MRIALSGLLLIVAGLAYGEEYKYQLSINHEGDDRLGAQLAYRIKEEVRKAATIALAPTDDDAYFSVAVITLAPTDDADPMQTIYSLVFTVRDPRTGVWLFWNSVVGFAGKDRIVDAASNQIVWITDMVEKSSKHRLELLTSDIKCLSLEDYTSGSKSKPANKAEPVQKL